MTLEEAQNMLKEKGISFELLEFQNETEYWHHVSLYPYTKNAKQCKVIAIIVRSNNGKKNIGLQFNLTDDTYWFKELWFGEYSFELFDCSEEEINNTLPDDILFIMSGKEKVIVANELSKKQWLGDMCFILTEDDPSELSRCQKALKRIQKPKSWFARLLNTKIQYEIYDWNTYRCVVK